MKYEITRLLLGEPGAISITECDFNEVRVARSGLVVVTGIEEKFDILLENYAEYEKELLDIALARMVHWHLDHAIGSSDRRRIARRLVNLLTVCRLYIDQVMHDVSGLYGADFKAALNAQVSQVYDKVFGYRVMYALRNYVQHSSLPVDGVVYPASWIDTSDEDRRACKYGLQPFLRASEIENTFKSSVLREIKEQLVEKANKSTKNDPNAADHLILTPLVRKNVEAIATIHEFVREKTNEDVEEWEACLRAVLQRAEQLGEPQVGIAVVSTDDSGFLETLSVFPELLDLRKTIADKNRSLGNLAARYVTGEVWS